MPHEWTTRVESALTEPHGYAELHIAFFAPPGWSGQGPVVGLLVPECELQMVRPGGPALVNRPQENKNVKSWTRTACAMAKDENAVLTVTGDTVEQIDIAARRIARWLPKYNRIPLERMYEAKNRVAGALN